MFVPILLGALLAAAPGQPPAEAPCPVQPLPPAIDALPPAPGLQTITFGATPSLETPGRAWVVRLSREGFAGPAAIDIVRLRRQRDCNLYDVEQSWRAPLATQEFDALARQVTALATPQSPFQPTSAEAAVDGTGVELRMSAFGWDATRHLQASGPKGAPLASLFRALVLKHVPASERPSEDWRTPPR